MTTHLMPSAPSTPPRRTRRGSMELHSGDRLSQPEFHRRYEMMPDGVKAELIGGIVYMPSPLRLPHGSVGIRLATVLGTYEAATPGVMAADNATVILGDESEPQPDLHLRLLPEFGGQTRVNAQQYLVGPPELVIEVAHSSEAIDLHAKKEDYRRAGVQEYLVFCIHEAGLRAFDLSGDRELGVDADGVYRSRTFPGLWIEPVAALAGKTARLLQTLQRGIASAEHSAFVDQLKARASAPRAGKPKIRRRK